MRLLLLTLVLPIVSALAADTKEAFFENKVRPLFVEHCQECHGPEKHKGGLRLDSREGWQRGGDSGPALVPGSLEKSRLIKAISYTDRELKMPPKQKLNEADIQTLTTWIKSGAFDPRTLGSITARKENPASKAKTHWAYQPITHPKPPTVKDTSWPRNDLDRFVLAKLEANKMNPASDAPPEMLQRRLSYDLTGFPTSVDDPATSLNTNAFAERWAQHWLDAARFAESSGGGRTLPFKDAWRYRDYVIQSVRDDIPLDRFITEQIAGDLLPTENPEQRSRQLIATGFLVLGATNYEEQDKAALRMDIVDEQLDLLGKSILGMSIGCARCHDHKFDPIPTRDYYALAGILRSTKIIRDPKENVAHWIETPLPLVGDAEAKTKEHEAQVAGLQAKLDAAKTELKAHTPKREPKDGNARALAVNEVPGIVVDDNDAKKVGAWKVSTHFPTYIGDGYLTDDNKDKGTKTLTFVPKIEKAGRYEVRFSYAALIGRATNVPMHILHADGEEDISVDESTLPPIDGRFVSLGQYRFEANGQTYVSLTNEDTQGYVTADAVVFIPVEDLPKLAEAEDKDKDKDPKRAAAEKLVTKLTADLKKLEKKGINRPVAMTVAEHEDMGDCAIHIRGNIRNLGELAPRGFLTAATHGSVPSIPKDHSGRIELAQWLTSPSNTLTARVLANRVWMYLFGEGIVRTVDNFGVTGELPSNPELLDHLANKLVEGGWSMKRLIAYIIDSRAYRMSLHNPQANDPDNRMLSHQNRKRLDANAMRDAVLAISGKLDPRFLGPTIGTETSVVDANDMSVLNVEYNYVFTDMRRSVYTPAFRNKRLEMFDAFDFGNINVPIGKRNESAVAPQALFMMNHEFVVTQSREAAKKLLADKSLTNDAARLTSIYQQALGRAPMSSEKRIALDFVNVSAGEDDKKAKANENWSLLIQTLFGSVDFRYVE